MNSVRRVVSLFTVAFLFAGLAVFQYMKGNEEAAALSQASEDFKPKAGYASEPFQLPDLNDQLVTVGGAQGKLLFVNFWASWCGPCELEAPDLQTLHEKYGDRIQMIGVNATKFDKERAARAFVDEYEFTFPIVMDREGDITKMYRVSTFPTTFLIDSKGVIQERINGVITLAQWERLIEKWMNE